jgi:hypothetical protein
VLDSQKHVERKIAGKTATPLISGHCRQSHYLGKSLIRRIFISDIRLNAVSVKGAPGPFVCFGDAHWRKAIQSLLLAVDRLSTRLRLERGLPIF